MCLSRQEERVILAGPRSNADEFFAAMGRLDTAIIFFTTNRWATWQGPVRSVSEGSKPIDLPRTLSRHSSQCTSSLITGLACLFPAMLQSQRKMLSPFITLLATRGNMKSALNTDPAADAACYRNLQMADSVLTAAGKLRGQGLHLCASDFLAMVLPSWSANTSAACTAEQDPADPVRVIWLCDNDAQHRFACCLIGASIYLACEVASGHGSGSAARQPDAGWALVLLCTVQGCIEGCDDKLLYIPL